MSGVVIVIDCFVVVKHIVVIAFNVWCLKQNVLNLVESGLVNLHIKASKS
jgi:hypothetical protein